MKDLFILIFQDKKTFINIEFIFEQPYKKLFINGENISLKNREIEVFYLLASNLDEIVSKEEIIRVLLEKKQEEKLLDIDIKYSGNRVSEVIGTIEKFLCTVYKKEYTKNLFIKRKSKQGYLLDSNSEILIDKEIIQEFFDSKDKNKINSFYYQHKNSDFIKYLKSFKSFNEINYKEFLEESPYLDVFYGRKYEIDSIKEKLGKYNSICLYGAGGIGKTSIIKKLTEEIKHDFEIIIWKDLKNVSRIEHFLEDLFYKISGKKEVINNSNIKENIDNLLSKIEEKKILFIFDNFESLLNEKDSYGRYRNEFKYYQTFFELIYLRDSGETKIIITSREKPEDFRNIKKRIISLCIEWLDLESCRKILMKYGIFSDKQTINDFIYNMGGNPQLIHMISHTIKKVFMGNLNNFLNINSNLSFDIYNFLDTQFDKISEIEKKIIFTLTIPRKEVSFEYLFERINNFNKIDIINAVEVLIDRAFVAVKENTIYVQSIILEYFTKKINSLITDEIINISPDLLKTYFLVSANENIEIIEYQIKYFISEIIKLLIEHLSDINIIGLKIKEIISLRKHLNIEEQYILNSNIINILINSNLNLKDYNFQKTYLKNLYLKNIDLKEVDFSESHFDSNIFFKELGMSSSYVLSTIEPVVIFNIKNEIYKYFIETYKLEKIQGLNLKSEIKILQLSNDNNIIAFITDEKILYGFDLTEKNYIFSSKIINMDAAKLFFSDKNKHLLIYSFEGIEIYNLEKNSLITYINDSSIKFCYEIELLDSFPFLLMIKNDLSLYYLDYTKEMSQQKIEKTEISEALYIQHYKILNQFLVIHSDKSICTYDNNLKLISKKNLEINKNENIKYFFIDEISNKLFISGSKIWVFSYDNLELLNMLDLNIKNLKSCTFYYKTNTLFLHYNDFNIDIINLNTGKKLNNIQGLNNITTSIEKNKDYLYMYLFNSAYISAFSLTEMKVKKTINHKYSAITITTNSKNTLMALYNIEKCITLYDLNKNRVIKNIPIKENNTFCLDLNEDASILAYKDGSKVIFIDTIDSNIIFELETDSNVFSKAFKFSVYSDRFLCLDQSDNILVIEMIDFSFYKLEVSEYIIEFICINDIIYSISDTKLFITDLINKKTIIQSSFYDKLKGISYSQDLKYIFLISENQIYIFSHEINKIIQIIKTEKQLYTVQCNDDVLFGINIDGCIDYFDIIGGKFLKREIIPRSYEKMNIKNTTGLSRFKKDILSSLGAII